MTLINPTPLKIIPAPNAAYAFSTFVFGLLMQFAAHGEELHGKVVDRLALSEPPSQTVHGPGLSGVSLILRDSLGHARGKATTTSAGLFRFRQVKPGLYNLSLSRKGYAPSPMVRQVTVSAEDTSGLWLYLDPRNLGDAKAAPGKKNKALDPNYGAWARGFLASSQNPYFWRKSQGASLILGRFFDPLDTTNAYRQLWLSMLWLEIEGQDRPLASKVRMAQALDSLLQGQKLSLNALAVYRQVSADSLASLTKTLRAIALRQPASAKSKTPARPKDLKALGFPSSLVLEAVSQLLSSASLPVSARKNLASEMRGFFGSQGDRQIAAAMAPSKGTKPDDADLEPYPSPEALWEILLTALQGDPHHSVALYHEGWRHLDQGRLREASATFDQGLRARPDYTALLRLKAEVSLRLYDTAAAASAFSALANSEDGEAQILGHRGMGKLHFNAGRFELAEQSYWRAQGLDGRSDEAKEAIYALAAVSLSREKDGQGLAQVETLLDSLSKREPRNAKPHFWLGRMALKNHQEGLAASHFQKAAALAPREPAYAEALAGLQAGKEEWPNVLKTLTPHRKNLSPDGLSLLVDALLHVGRSAEAVAECEKLYGKKPNPKSLARWTQALISAGQPAKAVILIEKSPHAQNEVVRVMLALAKLESGAVQEAIRILTPIVANHPTDPTLHLHLGRCHYALRDYRRASSEFGEALRYRDDLSDALYYKGLSLLKLGSPGESHHYFLELEDKRSQAWKAKGLLGRGQAFAQEGKSEAAEERLRRSFITAPTAEAAAHLALVLLKSAKKTEAESWARKARDLDRHLALGTMALSDALMENGKKEEALSLAESDLDSHPQSCDHLMAAAKANYRADLDARAKDISQQALRLCPQDPGPHFYLGAVSARSGAKKEAKNYFEAYLESGGDADNVPRGYR